MAMADKRGDCGGLDEDTAMAMAVAVAIANASLMNFFFLFRLVDIVDPQWHFGSTFANRLVL